MEQLSKNSVDNYIESNRKSTTCKFCRKQYSLRTKAVHEKHCLVRLANESEVNSEKMTTFCLRAFDINDIPLEKPSDFLKLTKANLIPKKNIEEAYAITYMNANTTVQWSFCVQMESGDQRNMFKIAPV